MQNPEQRHSLSTKQKLSVQNLRAGQLPDLSNFDKQVGEMFDTGHEGDAGAISDTIVGGKSSAVMPGPKKHTHIQARSENRVSGKKTRNTTISTQACKICSGSDCAPRFCRTLAQFGKVINPDRDHGYNQVLKLEIPIISVIEPLDYTMSAFDDSWEYVVLERMFRDDKDYKYVRNSCLNKSLDVMPQNLLYTFFALTQWLQTKQKRKQLLIERDVSFQVLTGEGFVRPRNVLRFNRSEWFK